MSFYSVFGSVFKSEGLINFKLLFFSIESIWAMATITFTTIASLEVVLLCKAFVAFRSKVKITFF
jgi:hypothetical protein